MLRLLRQYFILFCIVLTSCSKSVVSTSEETDQGPVAIRLNVSALQSISKAAVDKWDEDTISIFGLKQINGGRYDFTDASNILDYKTAVSGELTETLDVYTDPDSRSPYFYKEGYLYDFYGYHLGGATIRETVYEDYGISMHIEFDGSNDLMYASTDRSKDILKSGSAKVTIYDVYSAFAARNNVQPTLIFNHALTRFNFITKGFGDKYDSIEIKALEIMAINSGRLSLSKDNVGFKPDEDSDLSVLSLRDAQGNLITGQEVTINQSNTPLGGDGACLMIPEGMKEISITLIFRIKENGEEISYTFPVKAADIENQTTPSDMFLAGLSYNIFINIYGPEEIKITGSVQRWLPGGDFFIDPDDHEGITSKPGADMITNGGVSIGDFDNNNLGDIYL